MAHPVHRLHSTTTNRDSTTADNQTISDSAKEALSDNNNQQMDLSNRLLDQVDQDRTKDRTVDGRTIMERMDHRPMESYQNNP